AACPCSSHYGPCFTAGYSSQTPPLSRIARPHRREGSAPARSLPALVFPHVPSSAAPLSATTRNQRLPGGTPAHSYAPDTPIAHAAPSGESSATRDRSPKRT